MNNFIKSLGRVSQMSNIVTNNFARKMSSTTVRQSLWTNASRLVQLQRNGARNAHSSVEKELHQFLDNEIKTEEQTSDKRALPSTFEGFKVLFNVAEVELVKETLDDETITVKFNINHSVQEEEIEGSEKISLRSKPDFEVDIIRGNVTLGFNCSYASGFDGAELEEANDDVFHIDELTVYKNNFPENNYALSGDTLDADLYDLLMSFLADKGVTSEFVEKLSDLSTQYEQSVYINFLNDLKKFF
ncbi:complement component 1 Q subcomponent-binding protein, mitochondrial [Adelges cooleyi]|uniref:complement component 1 Q subcomponent-binding protein, mitochondrial n=1 Tax=Adelges cooleyi TaxID=133065 RepID=UPI00217FED16|nr:complement component 1 Q subcomponent-binding protein, mitochondrial [Adelges cooleyi]